MLAAFLTLFMSSCMTTKTTVGDYKQQQGQVYTYGKAKQAWLFWGLIRMGTTRTATPADGNCQVVTRYNFGDIIISWLTGGIIITHTIKVKAKRPLTTPTSAK